MHEDVIIAITYKEAASNMKAAAEAFRKSVIKFGRFLGMQAENDQRKAVGASMAFSQVDFEAIQRDDSE